jgi:hypothetical protein
LPGKLDNIGCETIHRRWPGQRPVDVDEKAPDRARVPGAEM